VQLASVRSEADARRYWTSQQQRFPDLLGHQALRLVRIDLGARGIFYRVQAGPFDKRNDAEAVCTRLKQEKQDCMVVQR
jgi:hypothetical protein